MFKATLTRKFILLFLVLSLAGPLTVFFLGRYHFKKFYYEEKAMQLESVAKVVRNQVVAMMIENNQPKLDEFLEKKSIELGHRITVMQENGDVLFDTLNSNQQDMLNLQEVQTALTGKQGLSIRKYPYIDEEWIYVAVPLSHKNKVIGVLRLAYQALTLQSALWSYLWKVFWGTLGISFLVAIALTYSFKKVGQSLERIRKYVEGFAFGKHSDPIPMLKSDTVEVQSLIKSLNLMSEKMDHSFNKIERQRNEREAIFSGMSEGVLSVYMDYNIFHWNKSACQFFDVKYSQDLKGKPVIEVFRNKQIFEFIDKVKQQKYFIEEEFILANGKVLQVHGSLLKHSDGKDLGVLMVFNDITRLRKLESHRKEFVANVSHELRTPLTSIHGYVENLLDGSIDIPDIGKTFLQTIKRNAERLHHITEDLLALSELDTDKHQESVVEFENCDIDSILKSTQQYCTPKAKQKNISIEVQSDLGTVIPVNARLLEQALSNLIDNAIKYSDPGTQVKLKSHVIPADNIVKIDVIDQGPGIPKDHQERLFERFYSVDKARSRELGGSGLGLSIVKNISLAHKGSVQLQSEMGKGSVFSILLPLKRT